MKKILKYVAIGFSVFIILFCLLYLFLTLFVAQTAELDSKTKSDIILVLGARSYINGSYNPCLVVRVDHAVELYKQKFALKILVSGGFDKEDHSSEAETMRKMAIERGVASQDILLEKKATSTYENFSFSKKILQAHHFNSVLIVTEPFHAPRASLVAQKLGLQFSISPASKNSCWLPRKYLSRYFLKEPLAIMAYKVEGKL